MFAQTFREWFANRSIYWEAWEWGIQATPQASRTLAAQRPPPEAAVPFSIPAPAQVFQAPVVNHPPPEAAQTPVAPLAPALAFQAQVVHHPPPELRSAPLVPIQPSTQPPMITRKLQEKNKPQLRRATA